MVTSLASASIATGLSTLPQESSLAVLVVTARLPHTLLIALLAFFSTAAYASTLLRRPAAAAQKGPGAARTGHAPTVRPRTVTRGP